MGQLGTDLRDAWRSLRGRPGYVFVMVVSLALGLGAGIAAFGVVDAIRLRALPFPSAERLVVLTEVPAGVSTDAPGCGARCDVSYATFANVLRRAPLRSVDAVVGFTAGGKVFMAGGEPVPVMGGVLTPDAFALLGVTPALGRPLLPSDDQLGVPLVTVLSHDFWTNQLGGDSTVLGRVIKLSDSQYTVVGVMPAGFDFESGSKFWLPAVPTLDPSTRPSIRSLTVMARLSPGRTISDARAEMASLEIPESRGAAGPIRMTIDVAPLRSRYVQATQSHDTMFAAMVACLLALTVANLANLSLVRALDQRRDVTVRAALGGTRWRLAWQLGLQHVLLVLAGGAGGMLVAVWLFDLLRSVAVLTSLRPSGMEAGLDWHTAWFALGLTLVTGAVLALAPIRVALEAGADSALRASAGSSAPHSSWQRVLVVVQVAGAFALLAAGLQLQRSSAALGRVSTGFDATRIVQASPSFPHPWRVPGTYRPVTERILLELQQVPGVAAAAVRTSGSLAGAALVLDGGQAPLPAPLVPSTQAGVSEAYFATLGIGVIRGRAFDPSDVADGAPVAIVNQWAARRWWPGADPVGRTVRVDTAPGEGTVLTVVGVVPDNRAAQSDLLHAEPGPELYRPWRQAATAFPTFVASTTGDAAALVKPMRDLMVRSVPDRPVSAVRLQETIDTQLGGMRTNAAQAGWMALAGLLIAWIGIHGVTAYTVRRRTREIGIRSAMGATPRHIVRLLLREVVVAGMCGVALGLPLALAAGRLMEPVLFHVRAFEPGILLAVAAGLLGVMTLAAGLPTWRALHIPAVDAVRADSST